MSIRRRFLWTSLLVLIFSAWAATSVSAHALLLRSNPAANAVLTQPPVQVELFFSEAVEEKLSTVKVFDSNGAVVDVGDMRVDPADPTRMTVSLHSLSDGVFTVTWKVVSAVDGHQGTGSFPFAVGAANAGALPATPQSTSFNVPVISLASKFLLLAALAILVGQRLFLTLVWEPALKDAGVPRPTAWSSFYRSGLVGVLIAIGIGILSQAGQATGTDLTFPWDAQVGHILIETRLGVIWLLRFGLAIVAVWLVQGQASMLKDWLGFAANLGLLLTITLTSHAATEARPWLPILADWLHLIGMAFWLGGLIHLSTGVRQLQGLDDQTRTKFTSLLTSQFSINAIIFVALIGVTGLYSAWLRVGAWLALLDSLYGHVLLIKQIFVAGLLAIAALNYLVITPRLKRARLHQASATGLTARFGAILAVDLTLAGLLLASVSFLTYVPPAKTPAPPNTDFTDARQVHDLHVEIYISPARVGENEFMLMLIGPDGQPVDTAKEVLLRFTPGQANVPPSELQMIGDGSGMFVTKGANLSLPDTWQVQAIVRRQDKFDVYANFDVTLRKPGIADKTAASKQAAGLLLAIGLCAALMTITVQGNKGIRLGVGIPLALFAMALGVYYLTRPPVLEEVQANPIPLTPESVAAGKAIYDFHCALCHGESAKGDGPLGAALNPRPADLTLHAVPGVHTDAQLFEWISNGFPGSQMPPFKAILSDTDRWNLVNYIRTLAPK